MAGMLVVDDDPVSRRVLMTLLGAAGERVLCASSGTEALAIIDTFRPALACIDLNMPDMSGFELVAEMQSRLEDDMPAVVMLTASGDPEDASRAEAAGVDRYLTKPVGSRDVATILDTRPTRGVTR